MDLLAALALAAVIEGVAMVIFASSLPALIASARDIGPEGLRRVGGLCVIGGAVAYLFVRGAF